MADEKNTEESTEQKTETDETATAETKTDETDETATAEETETAEMTEEETPKKLVARYPILYLSHQYKVGDALPANDQKMLAAWLESGAAKWVPDTEAVSVKAKTVTAEPGLTGSAVGSDAGDGNNLVGKVPKTVARSKKK